MDSFCVCWHSSCDAAEKHVCAQIHRSVQSYFNCVMTSSAPQTAQISVSLSWTLNSCFEFFESRLCGSSHTNTCSSMVNLLRWNIHECFNRTHPACLNKVLIDTTNRVCLLLSTLWHHCQSVNHIQAAGFDQHLWLHASISFNKSVWSCLFTLNRSDRSHALIHDLLWLDSFTACCLHFCCDLILIHTAAIMTDYHADITLNITSLNVNMFSFQSDVQRIFRKIS